MDGTVESRFVNVNELDLDSIIDDGGQYNLTVSASNMIGRGPASDSVVYQVDDLLCKFSHVSC